MAKEKIPCKFCGNLFHWKGIGVHQAACKENPARAKSGIQRGPRKLRHTKRRLIQSNLKIANKMAQALAAGRSSKGVWRAEYVTDPERNLTDADRTFDAPMTSTVSVLVAKLSGNVEGWLRAQAEGHRLHFPMLAKIVAAHLVGQNP